MPNPPDTTDQGDPTHEAVSDALNRRLEAEVALKTRELAGQRQQLEAALAGLRCAQSELMQSQKLTAIGQLAAGVAHEINTPIQYVGDNLTFLQRVFVQLLPALECAAAAAAGDTAALVELATRMNKLKLPRIAQQVPRALDQSLEGVGRVSKIVGAMKAFSHPSGGEKADVDIRAAIESTVTVARNEWKYVADLEIDIPDDIPAIVCARDELNQVILNLVVNAAHAIADVIGADGTQRGTIRVSVRVVEGWCEIRISDTGGGIPDEVRARVFEPFFTTKAVGQGTGQGLAIARAVVVDKHGGTIEFESTVGVGTTFIIRIPRDGAEGKVAA